MQAGDVSLLVSVSGGYGLYVQKEVEMVEVKQGSYWGNEDRFVEVSDEKIRIKILE